VGSVQFIVGCASKDEVGFRKKKPLLDKFGASWD